jgi:hypothetical protein
VSGEFPGTAYFPGEIPTPQGHAWKEVHRESHPADEKNPFAHRYIVVDLVPAAGEAGQPLKTLSLIDPPANGHL